MTKPMKVCIGKHPAYAPTVLENVKALKREQERQSTDNCVKMLAFKTNIYMISCGHSVQKLFEVVFKLKVFALSFRLLCTRNGGFHL